MESDNILLTENDQRSSAVFNILRSMRQRSVITSNLARLNKEIAGYNNRRHEITNRKITPPTHLGFRGIISSNEKKCLVPIRLELETLHYRDILLLEANIPAEFVSFLVQKILSDYNLNSISSSTEYSSVLSNSITSQLAEYREFAEKWSSAKEALSIFPNLLVKLDLLFTSPLKVQVIDQLEWTLNDDGDAMIEKFAAGYRKDLGLPQEAEVAVAFSIIEQLYLARRALIAAGLDPVNDESLQALLISSASNGNIMRSHEKRDTFTPLVETLNDIAFERAEQSHDRANRRRKRNLQQAQKRKRTDTWSIMGSPPRVYSTPINASLGTRDEEYSDGETRGNDNDGSDYSETTVTLTINPKKIVRKSGKKRK
jgi:hypothetical protein